MSFKHLIFNGPGPLRNLIVPRRAKRKRASSHDPTGGNSDRRAVGPGESHVMLDHHGCGCITHIWITLSGENTMFRDCVLRMYWDSEDTPSVEVPVGDFFGIGHNIVKNWWSLPINAGPQDGRGFNCFFPMPFKSRAKIEFCNESNRSPVRSLYYYVDYEVYDEVPCDEFFYFHAQWRRENPCKGLVPSHHAMMEHALIRNVDGKQNYVFVEAEGKGHVVGVILNVHNLRPHMEGNWWGEGDDMWWIDDDFDNLHPDTGNPIPSITGTGSEDFFCMSWCPTQEFCAPQYGISLYGASGSGSNISDIKGSGHFGKHTYYRFFLDDPMYFDKKIKGSIEHGHGNGRNDDFSSVTYWYQSEPHVKFPNLPAVGKRSPNNDNLPPLDIPGMEDEHFLWDDQL